MNQPTVSRPTRVAQEIKRTLAQLIVQEVKDPRFQKMTITECQISKDLSVAKIHFSLIGCNSEDPEVAETLQALQKAKGFFRSEIGKRLQLRIVPDLRFYFDTVPERVQHIEDLINKALNKK
ncbi:MULTISPECIES: 30S ribosome-binding factor RbfA [Thiomicrorhabdus]|uniref:Ribosome-binding factor A n=1 Tax=Thiomicrorhabdus heinhorstiae TaxID=2748010 RepID=A0ABS0BT37_9GAMM|nr:MULTISPECIES: 30S ribosome-binding factor RbfA [Thiomicrorhabdus]MBF6056959.1 30S ribosome-binding factor RbfA [Thiomicrorhabdus heinhorstiae]